VDFVTDVLSKKGLPRLSSTRVSSGKDEGVDNSLEDTRSTYEVTAHWYRVL